jgi:hypothetical protein
VLEGKRLLARTDAKLLGSQIRSALLADKPFAQRVLA